MRYISLLRKQIWFRNQRVSLCLVARGQQVYTIVSKCQNIHTISRICRQVFGLDLPNGNLVFFEDRVQVRVYFCLIRFLCPLYAHPLFFTVPLYDFSYQRTEVGDQERKGMLKWKRKEQIKNVFLVSKGISHRPLCISTLLHISLSTFQYPLSERKIFRKRDILVLV